jgi:hypothetical protein
VIAGIQDVVVRRRRSVSPTSRQEKALSRQEKTRSRPLSLLVFHPDIEKEMHPDEVAATTTVVDPTMPGPIAPPSSRKTSVISPGPLPRAQWSYNGFAIRLEELKVSGLIVAETSRRVGTLAATMKHDAHVALANPLPPDDRVAPATGNTKVKKRRTRFHPRMWSKGSSESKKGKGKGIHHRPAMRRSSAMVVITSTGPEVKKGARSSTLPAGFHLSMLRAGAGMVGQKSVKRSSGGMQSTQV